MLCGIKFSISAISLIAKTALKNLSINYSKLTEQGSPNLLNPMLEIAIQCPLDIATLDIAAALAIATSTPVTDLRQYINSDLGYNDLKF